MSVASRPTGEEGFRYFREIGSDVDRWYFDHFYERMFFGGGRVDVRYKELLRLKLSVIQGCFT